MSDYRQCQLENGRRRQTAWLPCRYARKGGTVALKVADGQFEDGWRVVAVGTVSPPAYVLEHKSHRRGDFGSLVA